MKTAAMFFIRPERPEDFPAIYALIERAFRTAEVSDGDEQHFTDRLRAGGGYIPELGLVAESGGELTGHILLTRFPIARADGTPLETLLIAPLSVALEHRSQGVGSALLREGLHRGRELCFPAALLLGDPAYYGRFGFRQSTEFGIRNTDGIPDRYVQAMELLPGSLRDISAALTFTNL